MTFQPVIPLNGYAGWLFLDRTADTQRAAFNESPTIVRAADAFRDKIASVTTAEDLVADRELLTVALGAFGLDDDYRLSDTRYAELSDAFGFAADSITRTGFSLFTDEIIDRYETQQFNKAVGEQNNDMRLALNLGPALDDVVASTTSKDAQWFSVMGNAPLRSVFETALGFPSTFGTLDIDQQLEQFKSRANATFGTDNLSDLTSDENQEKLIRLYLLRTEATASSASSGSIALTLLQQL